MARNSTTPEERDALLRELKQFRDRMSAVGSGWTRRSGLRRASDAVIDELDEMAMVLTGNREALLDPLHRTPGPRQ